MASGEESNLIVKEKNEDDTKKCPGSKYPLSVFLILSCEFCERFSYYGLKAVLVLFLVEWLHFDKNSATAVYHGFPGVAYSMAVLGAIIADGYIGRYKTILYFGSLFAVGCLVLSLTSMPPPERLGPLLGLVLIAVGTGGIKPCVGPFGADQYSPEQEQEKIAFFSMFFFVINLGSLISTPLTPILRADIDCFHTQHCFPLAFGVPGILTVCSLAIFLCGTRLYKISSPKTNVIGRMLNCITTACKNRWKRQKGSSKDHWLDYAEGSFEKSFISDVKTVISVVLVLLPCPIAWSLLDQNGSRWTLQATYMNGDVGVLGRIKADQMVTLNIALILLFIPILEWFIYPLLALLGIPNRPLQRMMAGMFCLVLAFSLAGILHIHISYSQNGPIDKDESGLKYLNAAPYQVNIRDNESELFLNKFEESQFLVVKSGDNTIEVEQYDFSIPGQNISTLTYPTHEKVILTQHYKSGKSYFTVIADIDSHLRFVSFLAETRRPDDGFAFVSIAAMVSENMMQSYTVESTLRSSNSHIDFVSKAFGTSSFQNIKVGKYSLDISNQNVTMCNDEVELKNGGTYIVVLFSALKSPPCVYVKSVEYQPPNSLSIFWQIPQIALCALGECLFCISGYSFSYMEVSTSMKSVGQAAWLLTISIGNVIVVIIAGSQFMKNQAMEFFLFAGVMCFGMVMFAVLSSRYQYVSRPITPVSDIQNTNIDQNTKNIAETSK